MIVEHADLPVEAVDGAVHQGLAELHASIVDQVASVEIVGAVDHQVVGAYQFQGVVGIQRGVVGVDLDMTVEVLQALLGGLYLGHAEGAVAVDDLALQVAAFHHVKVHQPQGAHPGSRQIQADRRAQTASADDQHLGFLEVQLTFATHPGEGDVAHVALYFFIAQCVDIHAAGGGKQNFDSGFLRQGFVGVDQRFLGGKQEVFLELVVLLVAPVRLSPVCSMEPSALLSWL